MTNDTSINNTLPDPLQTPELPANTGHLLEGESEHLLPDNTGHLLPDTQSNTEDQTE